VVQGALTMALPTITDPRHEPVENPNFLQRFGLGLINDERDAPFLPLMVSTIGVLLPAAILLYVHFRWWLAVPYLAILFGVFFDRCILMLHLTSHRIFFKPRVRWMNQIIPWVLCPLIGQSPETYFGHHMGMHHPENNLEDDLSTTMGYRRDRFTHFLHYFLVFFLTCSYQLPKYLIAHRRRRLGVLTIVGELLFIGGTITGLVLAPWPTLVVFAIPFTAARFLMMWGNWGQHAFIDAAHPESAYVNSITCVNTRYNRRCFNDGYHIGHHIKANRHWTEMPKDLEDNRARYGREDAIVFDGIDFFQVSLYLFLKRWDKLAGAFVETGERTRSKEQIIALLKERTLPIHRTVEQRAAA
jgi:fatty acid desaturase